MKPDLLKKLFQVRTELHGYIYAVVRDYHAAEDILQDVAVTVAEKADGMDEIRDFRAWTKEVARRKVLAHLRKRREKAGRVPVDELVEAIGEACDETTAPAELAEELEALRACIERAPERARAIVRMRLADDESFGAIARLFKMTEVAVRKVLSRTRKSLADCLQQKMHVAERGAS